MILNPRIGQRVRLHYAKRASGFMPHHGCEGSVLIAGRARPRNHLVQLSDGQQIVVPCGNLQPVSPASGEGRQLVFGLIDAGPAR
ncbi:hypothetical protein U5801_11735 [Lamprobacter modestohalophilus]|uniref:hypothetical protein n=1 Tax=Lamprobacter modestohalophilus TaxID=1064514 RepID=UPI002ADEE3FA|nr:hypothetical protein [Lamprobacter modestohalophilus]MEA1050475.1 hypothetical protein [Lamprobacter modestohalophilus]